MGCSQSQGELHASAQAKDDTAGRRNVVSLYNLTPPLPCTPLENEFAQPDLPRTSTEMSMQSAAQRVNDWSGKKVKEDLNSDLAVGFSVNSEDVSWHQAEHCMLCYLGASHDCQEPEWLLERERIKPIKRKVLFATLNQRLDGDLSTSGFGGYSISKYAAYVTYMVRYERDMCKEGAEGGMPHHAHEFGEEYHVLRGSFNDSQITVPALTWVLYPPGSDHHAYPENCDILTWWGQMHPSMYKAKPLPWWTDEMHNPIAPKKLSITFATQAVTKLALGQELFMAIA